MRRRNRTSTPLSPPADDPFEFPSESESNNTNKRRRSVDDADQPAAKRPRSGAAAGTPTKRLSSSLLSLPVVSPRTPPGAVARPAPVPPESPAPSPPRRAPAASAPSPSPSPSRSLSPSPRPKGELAKLATYIPDAPERVKPGTPSRGQQVQTMLERFRTSDLEARSREQASNSNSKSKASRSSRSSSGGVRGLQGTRSRAVRSSNAGDEEFSDALPEAMPQPPGTETASDSASASGLAAAADATSSALPQRSDARGPPGRVRGELAKLAPYLSDAEPEPARRSSAASASEETTRRAARSRPGATPAAASAEREGEEEDRPPAAAGTGSGLKFKPAESSSSSSSAARVRVPRASRGGSMPIPAFVAHSIRQAQGQQGHQGQQGLSSSASAGAAAGTRALPVRVSPAAAPAPGPASEARGQTRHQAAEQSPGQAKQPSERERKPRAGRGGRVPVAESGEAAGSAREEQLEEAKSEEPGEPGEPDQSEERLLSSAARRAGRRGYFQQHSGGRAHRTSDNTLEDLPQLSSEELAAMWQKLPVPNSDAKELLVSEYESRFPAWLNKLRDGHNLLFYGLGSKKALLQDFARQCLTDAPLLVVHGYFPAAQPKAILTQITSGLLQHSGSFKDVAAQLDFIRASLAQPFSPVRRLYLLLHNIDGTNLRSRQAQALLSLLAAIPGVHLVASIDHILAPLLWDDRLLSRFSWLYQEVTTFRPYDAELTHEAHVVSSARSEAAARHIPIVLHSLTPNHRLILQDLARLLLGDAKAGSPPPPPPQGIQHDHFYNTCLHAGHVSSSAGFKTLLRELIDHRLLVCSRHQSKEHYTIPHPPETIRRDILSDGQN